MNEKKKMSTGAKVGIGCGSGCLVLILVLAVASFFGYRTIKGMIDETRAELEALGFTNVSSGQVIELKEPVAEKKLIMGQTVKIMQGSSSDLAIMAQIAEIFGTIEGDLYFRGQVLNVQPSAVIKGNLDIQAQVLQNYGKVEGEIRGAYMGAPEASQ